MIMVMRMIPLDGISNLVNGLLDRVWPNPTETEKAKLESLRTEIAAILAIHATNTAEAQHPSIFVAGWRPFIGWTGGFGCAYAWLIHPFLVWGSRNFGIIEPPEIDVSLLWTTITGMLGFGAWRTVEAVKGVKREGWKNGNQ